MTSFVDAPRDISLEALLTFAERQFAFYMRNHAAPNAGNITVSGSNDTVAVTAATIDEPPRVVSVPALARANRKARRRAAALARRRR